MRILGPALITALLVTAAPALAADSVSLFREGRFAETATAARSEATPESLALAARATLVIAAYQTADRDRAEALIAQAARDTDIALAKQPANVDAQLQRAIATGYKAKLERSPKLGKQARKLMDAVRIAAPNNATAWAALGGWHGEAVADLGSMIAGTVLGAKKSEALKAYETAIAKDPKSPVFPTFYAFTLLRLDEDNAARATTLLEAATRLQPRDGFEMLLRRQAADVLARLRADDLDGAARLVARYQPFGQILSR